MSMIMMALSFLFHVSDRKRFDRDREEKAGRESFTIGVESLHHRANCKIARSNNSKNVIAFLQKWKNRIIR